MSTAQFLIQTTLFLDFPFCTQQDRQTDVGILSYKQAMQHVFILNGALKDSYWRNRKHRQKADREAWSGGYDSTHIDYRINRSNAWKVSNTLGLLYVLLFCNAESSWPMSFRKVEKELFHNHLHLNLVFSSRTEFQFYSIIIRAHNPVTFLKNVNHHIICRSRGTVSDLHVTLKKCVNLDTLTANLIHP